MIDYSRYYRAYAEMKQTLEGDYAQGYLTGAMADANNGNDDLSGNACNRVIDMDWVIKIEETLPYIEKAINEQRKFIEEHKEVDRIDKVKQVGKDAVQHLTQHTNLIQSIEPDGSVVPSRLLNIHREDSFATYENRFLYTLIFKTIAFVEARFRALQNAPNDSETHMTMSRDVKLNNQKFNFNIDYSAESHDRDHIGRDEEIENLTDYERIERIRMRLDDFVGTELIKTLSGCIQVKSPINKTNCIKKDPAFKQCHDLWVFIEAYRKTGYVLEINEYSGEMPEDVQKEIYDVMAFEHFVMTISTNKALKEKLHAEYVAENERREREANKPEEELARYIEDQIYEAKREEMALRLKEVREREAIIARLTSELEIEKEKVRERDLKIEQLQALLEVRERELEETREELRLAQQRVAELEAELEQAKARIAELETKVEELEATVAAQLALISSLQDKVAQLEEEVARLSAELEEARARIAELETKVAELEETVAAQLALIASLQDNVAQLQSEIATLNAQIEEHKATIAQQSDTIAKNEDTITNQANAIAQLNDMVADNKVTIDNLSADVQRLNSTVESQSQTITTQADDIKTKDEIISASAAEKAMLCDKLSTLEADYNSTIEKYSNVDNQLSELNSVIAQNDAEKEELNHQIRVHLNMLSAKDAIIDTLNKEKESMNEKADEFAKSRDSLSEKEAEVVALNNSMRTQVATLKSRDAEIKELKKIVEESTASKEKEISELTAKHNAEIEAMKAHYEEKIAQLEKEKIAACNFSDEQKFSARLEAEKEKIKADYDKQLKEATKKARSFVKKAKVLSDYKPESIAKLDGVEDYID